MSEPIDRRLDRTYHVLGVPLRAGSWFPGSENDAKSYREEQFVARLRDAGWTAVDEGDVAIPSYLPHHTLPPIRNWPAPRIAWDFISERVQPLLQQPGHVPLLIGCDCSVVLGTTHALARASRERVHVIYVDGDMDDAAPDAEQCESAAASAVWLLTHESPFWIGPPLDPSQVTVIGFSNPPRTELRDMRAISMADVRRVGPRAAAQHALAAIPSSAPILLHFDIDVFQQDAMPASYFPHAEGLTLAEGTELFRTLSNDPRIRVIEVSEYASLRDLDRQYVSQIVEMLAHRA